MAPVRKGATCRKGQFSPNDDILSPRGHIRTVVDEMTLRLHCAKGLFMAAEWCV